MEPESTMPHSQEFSNNRYPELSYPNSVPRIETYFFKIHSNIVFPSMPRH
jgi:hypothetical protein